MQNCGDLTGKVLTDCTNPLTPDLAALEIGLATSGAEEVAKWAPAGLVTELGFETVDIGDLTLLRGQS